MLYKIGSRSISFGEIVSREIGVFSGELEKKGLFMLQRYATKNLFWKLDTLSRKRRSYGMNRAR